MVRGGEVEVGAELLFYIFVAVEFGSVIGGDGVEVRAMGTEEFDGALLGVEDGGLRQRSNAYEARFTIDDGEDGGLVGTVHGVDFPVVEPDALLDDGRAFGDQLFAGEFAAAIGLTVAFAFDFSRTAEMTPESATVALIGPNPQVDCLVAHDLDALHLGPADNLLGT